MLRSRYSTCKANPDEGNVIDDGSFSFAPDVVAKLTALKWISGRIMGTTRTTERVLYQGDALLLVERSASISYPER